MKIDGHRPYFETGPGVAPLTPQQAQVAQGQRNTEEVTRVAKVGGAVGSHARQSGDAAPITELKQKADKGVKTTDVTAGRQASDPLDDAAARNAPGYREPSLPQLSAEALATALMTAEPDKAVVPRILPGEMANTGAE